MSQTIDPGRGNSVISAVLALALCLAAGLSPAPAAQTRTDPQKPLQYDVSVTLKLVQVYVTGKDGKPVGDLTAQDFEINDNGRILPVTHFERHFLGEPDSPAALGTAAALYRKFFLFFDFAFVDPRGLIKAKNAALEFMANEVRPTDEIGLISYSAHRGLVLHEYLTKDHDKVRELIGAFGLKRLTGRAENLTNFVYVADLADTPEAEVPGPGLSAEDQFYAYQARLQQQVDDGRRQNYAEQARQFVLAMGNLAKVFRYIPGYKNMIVFSGGIARQALYGRRDAVVVGEWSTPEQLAQQMSDYDAAQADTGLRGDFTEMLKEFRASNTPIFAVDVSRTNKESDVTIQQGSPQMMRELEGADSLRQFASETGGKFYANSVDEKISMGDIENITSAYYVLGYSVRENWDGKFHKIKVRVNRKGCSVQSQGGYFSPKPYKDLSGFDRLLHITDLALSENPQFQVPEEMPVSAIPVMVKGWPQLLVVGKAGKSLVSDVLGKRSEAYLILFDENGDISSIKRYRMDIPETGKDTLFPSFLMPAKPGSYTCRMVLRNMETGRGARGAAPLVVPGSAGPGLNLDPPLLLTIDPRAQDLTASGGSPISSLFGYDANAYAPLIGDVPAGLTKLFAALRVGAGPAQEALSLSASLMDKATASQVDVPVTLVNQAQDGPIRRVFAELATGELKPGAYALSIEVRAQGSPDTVTATVDLIVK